MVIWVIAAVVRSDLIASVYHLLNVEISLAYFRFSMMGIATVATLKCLCKYKDNAFACSVIWSVCYRLSNVDFATEEHMLQMKKLRHIHVVGTCQKIYSK